MSLSLEPFPDVGDAAAVEKVRPGDRFLAGHNRRAASLAVQDRTAEVSMVGPRTDTVERTQHAAPVAHNAGAVEAGAGRGSVAAQLAAVEPLVRGVCRSRLGPADGDDAAQRTLLALWRRLESGPPIEHLPAYAAAAVGTR